ncbi:MAG TPA: hypothetical protein RMG45_03525, partial [Polyangiaceae bacterium LLY-WYZ-15_(1-7)]|nr:hypothetical protein [Polyangiaceae bacterium LLY-WYZ-15_(1-7)]
GGAFVESGGPTVADLEGDGRPEVVVGRWVLDGIHGRLRWRGRGDTGRGVNGPAGPISCVGDLDGDGRAEVVAGRTVFEADGRARWTAPGPDGWCALGPVRGEGEADVVLVGEGQLRVFAPNGRRVFARALVGASGLERGGPPALADVDGDGAAEIVVAHATALAVYDPGCAAAGGECEAPGLRWSVEVSDPSAATGVVLFDAEGDGAWELAHADQYFLRVLDARSGEVRSLVRNHSRTRTEAPVAADVDGDGRVDLAICSGGRRDDLTSPRPGVRVFGDWYGRWSDARGWAHGHAFDALFEGSLAPRRPERFRAVRASRDARAADLRVDVLRTECEADRVEVIARVWNAGERPAPAGVVVALYGDGVRLGEARTERILAPGERTVVALRGWRGEGRFRVEVDRPEDEREGGRVAECDEANAVLTRCE